MLAARDRPMAERTLPGMLARRLDEAGDAPFVRFAGDAWRSAEEVVERATALAGALAAAGVEPGDRVAMLCANRPELLDALVACAWRGAVAVPINTAARGGQLDHVLSDAEPRLLLVDAGLLDRLDEVTAPTPALERVWVAGDPAASGRWRGQPLEPMPLGGDRLPAHPVDPADTMAILYTSGTTGAPKGVCCPHAQFFWWGVLVGEQLGLGPGDTAYTVLPLFHTNALNAVAQVLASGARYAFGPRFSASGFWGEARAVGATVTYLLGAMVHILMKAPPSGSDRDHAVRIALSPATPAELATGFQERFGVVLMDGYGSTETNLVTSNLIGGHTPGTMGRPAPEFEVRAADDHDEELPPGVPGELLVRPREPFSCATGYWRRPEATVAAWRNLWFHTGDRVVREPDGTYRFVDRLKDAIRRRGENVSSFEVEQALVSHPDVESAAVVPVPSELSEDEVMAFVVPRAGRRLDPVDLVRHCEPHLAYFAIPRFVEVVDALPLTENGKVRKHVLRERGRGPATWDREAAGVVLRR